MKGLEVFVVRITAVNSNHFLAFMTRLARSSKTERHVRVVSTLLRVSEIGVQISAQRPDIMIEIFMVYLSPLGKI